MLFPQQCSPLDCNGQHIQKESIFGGLETLINLVTQQSLAQLQIGDVYCTCICVTWLEFREGKDIDHLILFTLGITIYFEQLILLEFKLLFFRKKKYSTDNIIFVPPKKYTTGRGHSTKVARSTLNLLNYSFVHPMADCFEFRACVAGRCMCS